MASCPFCLHLTDFDIATQKCSRCGTHQLDFDKSIKELQHRKKQPTNQTNLEHLETCLEALDVSISNMQNALKQFPGKDVKDVSKCNLTELVVVASKVIRTVRIGNKQATSQTLANKGIK